MMAKRIRKKTKAELASPKVRDRAKRRADVLALAYHACDRLAAKRRDFILDIADNRWIHRFAAIDDERAFRRESRQWKKLRSEFLKTATNPLELHWFSCHWNCDLGASSLLSIVKNEHCDAGTALRLYWLNDPIYYQDYRTIGDCPDDEGRSMLRILRTIERRFKKGDFATKRIPFDPAPWMDDDWPEEAVHEMPAVMREPIRAIAKRR